MRQGNDIVVGYFEPHARKDTIAKTVGLELVPSRMITYRAKHVSGNGYGRHFETAPCHMRCR